MSGVGRELVRDSSHEEVPACNFEYQRWVREDDAVELPRFFIYPSEEHDPPSRP